MEGSRTQCLRLGLTRGGPRMVNRRCHIPQDRWGQELQTQSYERQPASKESTSRNLVSLAHRAWHMKPIPQEVQRCLSYGSPLPYKSPRGAPSSEPYRTVHSSYRGMSSIVGDSWLESASQGDLSPWIVKPKGSGSPAVSSGLRDSKLYKSANGALEYRLSGWQ